MASSRFFMFVLWIVFLFSVSSSLSIFPVSTRYFVEASLSMESIWYRVCTLCVSSSVNSLLINISIGLGDGYLSVLSEAERIGFIEYFILTCPLFYT
jgi:hypothetical protein